MDSSYNRPPTIVFAPLNKNTFKPEITLLANVEDDKIVSRIKVLLNGVPISDDKFRGRGLGGTVSKGSFGSSKEKQIEQKVKLAIGKNLITVVAYDNENQVSRKSINVSYNKEKGEIWAVLIGISNYQVKGLNLKYADNDAIAMKDYLINDFGVPADHVTVLLNDEATTLRIRQELGTKLPRKAGKEDQVIIYFAGHGAPEQDVENPDGDGFEKYLLPMWILETFILRLCLWGKSLKYSGVSELKG